jgi:hypothetical protein
VTLLLLFGCQDYAIDFVTKDRDVEDSPPVDSEPEVETAVDSPVAEECNGIDDDDDGAVDEGFPDDDGDGVADCLEGPCGSLDVGEAGSVPVVSECQGEPTIPAAPVADPWNIQVKWRFKADDAYFAEVAPIVGNLNDDDGDGDVDADDFPEVLLVAGWPYRVLVLDGRDGTVEWQYEGITRGATPAIADVDADGYPDVAFVDEEYHLQVLEGDGTPKWTGLPIVGRRTGGVVNVADLDGDGHPEVIAADAVFDGATGSLLFSVDSRPPDADLQSTAIGDIDLDGDQEIVRNGHLYDSDGTFLWTAHLDSPYASFPLLVQADEDPEAEIAIAAEVFAVLDTDGSTLFESPPFGGGISAAGPPCAGDFDGDGVMEVAFPMYYDHGFIAYELDGAVMWATPAPWRTQDAGCAAYDFDGDGTMEIAYAADEDFYIYDGKTGDTLYTYTEHANDTIIEYPTIADVDRDGHADLLFVGDLDTDYALTVLEHAGEGWPAAGPTWSEHDYRVTNVTSDGAVPPNPEPSWLTNKVYRGRTAVDGTASYADLVVSITDVCVADCASGPVLVAVQVANQGAVDVSGGTLLSLYAEDEAGSRLVATRRLPALPAGTRSRGEVIELTGEDIGARGFVAVIDDGPGVGHAYECDEGNNRAEWRDIPCE